MTEEQVSSSEAITQVTIDGSVLSMDNVPHSQFTPNEVVQATQETGKDSPDTDETDEDVHP